MWKFLNGRWVLFAPENEGGAGGPGDEELQEDLDQDLSEEDSQEDTEQDPGDEELQEDAEQDPPTRRESRIQRLANERNQEREARIRAEERARLLEEQGRRQPATDHDAQRVRAEKLALMSPEEKAAFLATERAERVEQQLNLQQVQMQDFRDEARYDAIAATDTAKGRMYAKHKEWVEQELQKQRGQGRNPTREALLMVKLGHDVLNAKPSKKVAQKKQEAGQRVENSKAKPLSGRGAGAAQGGAKEPSLADLRAQILERERLGHNR